jgi:hypothetical protein
MATAQTSITLSRGMNDTAAAHVLRSSQGLFCRLRRRSEVDMYISDHAAFVTGQPIQLG